VCVSLLSACAESTPKGPKAFELTVGTYNLRNKEDWWEDRFPLIADGMVELRADILGLQEVSEREMQLETLSALLEERDPSLDYNVLFTLAAEPFGTLTGEGLASMAQFPIEDMGTLFLSEGRSATWTRVSLGNDRYLDHFNTHLHAIRSAPDVRAVQAASIVEYINEHDEGWPIVLTGDFNATDDEQAIATVVDAGFVDTFRAVHGDETDEIGATSPIKLAREPVDQEVTRRIDYVFLRAGDTATNVEIAESERTFMEPGSDGLYPSDHFGVLSTLRFELP
ncbi:MAG: endonuclease/exonuclease/phosphatase family protein, partial [Myxococcales bacterium]|nr:endonuclease/exonuclease/phosphatase family protein [Myxococcales bacterium]